MKRSNMTVVTALIIGISAGFTTGCFKGFESAKPSADDLVILEKGGDDKDKDQDTETPDQNQEETDTDLNAGQTEVPDQVEPGQESTPMLQDPPPADTTGGQTFNEVDNNDSHKANSKVIIASNDSLLNGVKDERAAQMVEAITITALGQETVSISVKALVLVEVEPGKVERRILIIDSAQVSYIEDADVMPFNVHLAKDLSDTVGVDPGSSVLAYAVCKDAACQTIQLRLDFQVTGGANSAVFALQSVNGTFTVAATNIATDLMAVKAFEAYEAEVAAAQAAATQQETQADTGAGTGDVQPAVTEDQTKTQVQAEAKMDPATTGESLSFADLQKFVGAGVTTTPGEVAAQSTGDQTASGPTYLTPGQNQNLMHQRRIAYMKAKREKAATAAAASTTVAAPIKSAAELAKDERTEHIQDLQAINKAKADAAKKAPVTFSTTFANMNEEARKDQLEMRKQQIARDRAAADKAKADAAEKARIEALIKMKFNKGML